MNGAPESLLTNREVTLAANSSVNRVFALTLTLETLNYAAAAAFLS